MFDLTISSKFNLQLSVSHHQEAQKDKVNCEITKIQHCTRKTKICICIAKYITKK